MSRAPPPPTDQDRESSSPPSKTASMRSLPEAAVRTPMACTSSSARPRAENTASSTLWRGGSKTRVHTIPGDVAASVGRWTSLPRANCHRSEPISPKRDAMAAAPRSAKPPTVLTPRAASSSRQDRASALREGATPTRVPSTLVRSRNFADPSTSRKTSDWAARRAARVPSPQPTCASQPATSAICPMRASARPSIDPAARTAPRAGKITLPGSTTTTWATCASTARRTDSNRRASRRTLR